MLSAAELWSVTRVAGKMIMMNPADRRAFETLELRIRAILPREYRDCYEEVEPVSMGSASLKFGPDGKVAWHSMWESYCDLAMAGGPPHRGSLLRPASEAEIAAEPERYNRVVDEICRGILLVTGLHAGPAPDPGWVRVECLSGVAAGWLARAIIIENVSVRCDGASLDLPAGPAFRVEKEIKNVVTVMAKTGHYWLNHADPGRQREMGELFAAMTRESPLIQPDPNGSHDSLRRSVAGRIREATGLKPSDALSDGWLGLICPGAKAAIWMMRALIAGNLFARREDTVLFIPINPEADPLGDTVVRVTSRAHGFAKVRGLFA